MSTNITDVAFDESHPLVVDLVNSVQGESSIEAEKIQLDAYGVHVSRDMVAETTTRFIQFFPWTNVKAIRQSWTV